MKMELIHFNSLIDKEKRERVLQAKSKISLQLPSKKAEQGKADVQYRYVETRCEFANLKGTIEAGEALWK